MSSESWFGRKSSASGCATLELPARRLPVAKATFDLTLAVCRRSAVRRTRVHTLLSQKEQPLCTQSSSREKMLIKCRGAPQTAFKLSLHQAIDWRGRGEDLLDIKKVIAARKEGNTVRKNIRKLIGMNRWYLWRQKGKNLDASKCCPH